MRYGWKRTGMPSLRSPKRSLAAEYYAFNTDHGDAETEDYETAMREALLIAARTFSP